MSKYKSTILKISVHSETENPVFGANATHISVDDEAGGPFLSLSQCNDASQLGEVRLDFEELDEIYRVSKMLKAQFKDNDEQNR